MTADIALLILRLVVGGLMVGHGAQKLFGVFGGHGLAGTTGFMASLGLRPPGLWARAAGGAEFGGGLLLVLGLLTPLGGLGIMAAMTMAIVLVHRGKGPWVSDGGSEYNFVIGTVGLVLILTGGGAYSLDAVLGLNLSPTLIILAAALTLLGIAVALTTRRSAPVTQQA